MQKGEAWTHIHLLDAAGKPVELPFLEIDQELWNPDHTRLTVLFDPGRIKRGVRPLVEVGPSIQQGKTLHPGDRSRVARWPRRAARRAVSQAVRRRTARPRADRIRRSGASRRRAPEASTRWCVEFPEPLDYAMLQHAITVRGVAGKVEVTRGEMEWRFTPDQPWKPRRAPARCPDGAGGSGRQSRGPRVRCRYVRADHADHFPGDGVSAVSPAGGSVSDSA